jgi:hypothetical protein
MRTVLALVVFIFSVASSPVYAGEKAGDPGTNVEMPFLIAPLTIDGKLFSYAYISTKVVTTSRTASLEVRDKIPFIQDAFVRDVNATPIAKAGDPKAVDRPALIARLTAKVKRIVGATKIAAVMIIQIQISLLHPIETPSQAAPESPPS